MSEASAASESSDGAKTPDPVEPAGRRTRWRGIAYATTAALVVGAAGSGLWEMLFKPGLTWFGRGLLTVLTLGSTVVRDQAYQSAALDPTPIPALQIVLLLGQLPAMAVVLLIVRRAFRKHARKLHIQVATETKSKTEQRRVAQERLDRFERRINRVMLPLMLLSALWALSASLVLNQAVLVHRVFQANLAICSPHMAEVERTRLVAAFASMESKSDYEAISKRLKQIAGAANVELREVSLW